MARAGRGEALAEQLIGIGHAGFGPARRRLYAEIPAAMHRRLAAHPG
jgi:hypothetical protein